MWWPINVVWCALFGHDWDKRKETPPYERECLRCGEID